MPEPLPAPIDLGEVTLPVLFLEGPIAREAGDEAIVVAVDRGGRVPETDPAMCDAMVTTALDPPAPWVGIDARRFEAQLETVRRAVAQAPVAAAILVRLLHRSEALSFDDALHGESLAYSTLLGGGEFARWLAGRKPMPGAGPAPRVKYERYGDAVRLTLRDAASRNAMTAGMRDALCEALTNVLDDPSLPRVTLTGEGKCFSTGGHLPEFGTQRDLALAHAVRMARSPARLLHCLGPRAEVALHGACIGSGIEIAAAAARRVGAADTFIQLPELRMGLIPGAGGTVTLPRAIGRHRTAWLALGGFRLGARQALAWGLLDEIRA